MMIRIQAKNQLTESVGSAEAKSVLRRGLVRVAGANLVEPGGVESSVNASKGKRQASSGISFVDHTDLAGDLTVWDVSTGDCGILIDDVPVHRDVGREC